MAKTIKPPEAFADVSLAELGMTVQDAAVAGIEVLEMWNGAPGMTRADAYVISKQRQVAGEASQAAWSKQLIDQRSWLIGRTDEYRSAYARTLAGRRDPSAAQEARSAAIKATLAYERRNPPERCGFPESVRTPADTAETLAPAAARWGAP